MEICNVFKWTGDRGVLLSSRNKRTVSCFVAVTAGNCDFKFARVDGLELEGDTPFVTLRLLSVSNTPRDPLFCLSGVSSESNDRGCRFTHVRRLECDPFSDNFLESLRFPINSIVGCCAVSSSHIALLPHPQLSFS